MADYDHEEEHMTSMSLGDHLEELRTRLILAIAGLFLGLVICRCFGSYLIDLLLIPYNRAIEDIKEDKDIVFFEPFQRYVINVVPFENAKEFLKNEKLRKSLAASDIYMVRLSSDDIEKSEKKSGKLSLDLTQYDIDTDLSKIAEEKLEPDEGNKGFVAFLSPYKSRKNAKKLTTIKPSEGFMVYIKTSLIFGLLLTSPWIIWQIWAFVASGLYQREKKFAYSVAPASAFLFIAGSVFFMWSIAPITMKFFVKFDAFLGFESQFRPSDYINMILMLTLVFGVAFQMPIVIVFAESMGLVSIDVLAKNRKFVILGIVVLAAMITPPEPISQMGLALPLYMLYELSIIACRFKNRKAKAAE